MNYNRCHAAKKIARKTFKKYHHRFPEHLTEKEKWMFDSVETVLGIYRKTRVFCSNPFCCGNPRHTKLGRSECLTLQELKADIDFNEQIKEIGL